jgi:hypothetical protein
MAGVKLLVIYPRPMAVDKSRRQNEVCRDQGLGNTGWDTPSVLPNRRGPFPVPGRIASLRAVRWWQGNRRPCRQNLEWWRPDFPGRRRAIVHVLNG